MNPQPNIIKVVRATYREVRGTLRTGGLLEEADMEAELRLEGSAEVLKSPYSVVYIYVKRPHLRKKLNVSICQFMLLSVLNQRDVLA